MRNTEWWLPAFKKEVFDILVEKYQHTEEESYNLIISYEKAFRLLEHDTGIDANFMAHEIDKNDKSNRRDQWIEYLSLIHDASETIATLKKIPEIENRPTEYCIKCNYPKYIDEECRFCK